MAPPMRESVDESPKLAVVGGGIAGCEAAWQAAERGVEVVLHEMRPGKTSAAHTTDRLAELVCSNSLGSTRPDRAGGILKEELALLDSLLLSVARETSIPGGHALVVDREQFGREVTERIESHPRISVVRQEVQTVPEPPVIVASGPLTSDSLASDLARLTGLQNLYFYDALSPIVTADSIDMSVAFRQSRYGKGETQDGDYINCPFDRAQFEEFAQALLSAEQIELRGFERGDGRYFEGCLPIEVLAARGDRALTFGPMRPVGLTDPRTGRRPYAVVQLRQDNVAASLYNLVGFQTNLRWPEQRRVLRLIPGLQSAEFVRLGQMHRNTFVRSPVLVDATLELREHAGTRIAGQLCGIEGYVGNIGSGLVAGVAAARDLTGRDSAIPPPTTVLGALLHYIASADPDRFQPMKANLGILPPLVPHVARKSERYAAFAERALADLRSFVDESSWLEAR